MAKKIILELTEAQFDALMALAEETVIMAGGTEEENSNITNRRARLVNKALRNNKIDFIIKG